MTNEMHDFSRQADPDSDRRSGERITSVYRPVLIETDGFAGFCLVRNLSAGGMMGSAYAEFAKGQAISVQFHPDFVITGTVVWSEEGRIGIAFDQKLDVEEVLRKLSEKPREGKTQRSPRLQIECDGTLDLEGRSLPIKVRDISQRGIKAEAAFVKPGEEVVVRLEGLEPHKALVRWTQNGLAGLNFVRPIAFEQLATWVIERQTR